MILKTYLFFPKIIIVIGAALIIMPFINGTALSTETDVVIIANKSVDTTILSKQEIKNIFTGVTTSWYSDLQINIVISDKTTANTIFVRKYLNKTPSQYKKWWKMMLFTGRGTMPKQALTDNDVIDYVLNTQGAIGYISASKIPDGVKIIQVADK